MASRLVLFTLSCFYVIGLVWSETPVIVLTILDGSTTLNVGEKLVLQANLTQYIHSDLNYYKTQDTTGLVTTSKALAAPFVESSDKYSVKLDLISSIPPVEAHLTFTISAVSVEDSGTYFVNATDKYGSSAHEGMSNSIEIVIVPSDATSSVVLTSGALKEGQMHNFDAPNMINCEGTSETTSQDLHLKILEDNNDISASFSSQQPLTSWMGKTSLLKIPMTSMGLSSESYHPAVGERTIQCVLNYKDKKLAEEDFETIHKADPKLNCTTNHKGEIKAEDTNIEIICVVENYPGNLNETVANWKFYHQSVKRNLKTGKKKYDRETALVNGKQVLRIPHVTVDIVTGIGKIAQYNVTLSNGQGVIANATVSLEVDGTVEIRSSSANCVLFNAFLILAVSVLLLFR